MDVNTLKSVYFIGAGGIGMSALVRYFLSKGKKVGGYDRTPSELTEKLIEEGADNLKTLKNKIDITKMKAPSFLMVLIGVGVYAYKRQDGVYVVPIGCLKD